jgi:hypothetical protein
VNVDEVVRYISDNVPKGEDLIYASVKGRVVRYEVLAEERIKIIATRRNEALLALGFREGMFEVFDARSTSMISDLVRKLNRIDPENWAEASAVYTIAR